MKKILINAQCLLLVTGVFFLFCADAMALKWKGRQQSDNVIDLRGGLPCDLPYNCVAGEVGQCDKFSCTGFYNTGLCKPMVGPNGTVVASEICQVIEQKCGGAECEPVTFPVTGVECPTRKCVEGLIIDPVTKTPKAQTGNCVIFNQGPHKYFEECEVVDLIPELEPAPVLIDLSKIGSGAAQP